MINFFIFFCTNVPLLFKVLKLRLLERMVRFFIRTVANVFLSIWFYITSSFFCSGIDKKSSFIISLTTFPARINSSCLCIESLLRQKLKPLVVVLWLSKEQFPSENIPRKLLKLKSRGLKICFKDGDLRSHKKYFYAIQEYADYHIVTVDDDIIYSSDMTQNLLENIGDDGARHVFANIVMRIGVLKGEIQSYNSWLFLQNDDSNFDAINVPIGAGGVLYPKGVFNDVVLRKKVFMDVAPKADDLWLALNVFLSGGRVFLSKKKTEGIPIQIRNNITLFSANEKGENDKQLKAIISWVKIFLDPKIEGKIIQRNSI